MADWRKREQQRVEAQKYRLVLWSGEWWATTEQTVDHFARVVGRRGSRQVGYMINGKLIRMRPGRYLKKFYSHILAPQQIKAWTDDIALMDVTVHFALTPEEITLVYEKGPKSCMSGTFPKSVMHPAAVYGAGDLAVAYLKDKEKITARVLCWPEKKVYARNQIYGDKRIEQGLSRLGYRRSGKKDQEFRGARLRAVPIEVGFLVPDVSMSCGRVQLCDDGFLRLRARAGQWASLGEAANFPLDEAGHLL